MALIRFIVDYRGVMTGEEYFPAGSIVDRANATELVDAGRAEYAEETPEPCLDDFNVKELRVMAKEAAIPGYTKLKRAELLKALKD